MRIAQFQNGAGEDESQSTISTRMSRRWLVQRLACDAATTSRSHLRVVFLIVDWRA
jgi:hypothetical protein